MTSISDQMSAVRNRQFDAQLDFMRAMTAQAFATAEQVLALNINTSRASVERTANTVRHLFSITDPRDLFSVGSHTQEQMSSLLAYSRELMSIAADARANLARGSAAMAAPEAGQQSAAPAEAQPQAGEPQVAQEPPAAPQVQMPEPVMQVVEVAAAQPEPQPEAEPDAPPEVEIRAKAKPIAKAVGKVAGKRADIPHPSAAVELADGKAEVRLPQIKPAEMPPAAAAALDLKQPASKSPRKK
jgi:phasin family protein